MIRHNYVIYLTELPFSKVAHTEEPGRLCSPAEARFPILPVCRHSTFPLVSYLFFMIAPKRLLQALATIVPTQRTTKNYAEYQETSHIVSCFMFL